MAATGWNLTSIGGRWCKCKNSLRPKWKHLAPAYFLWREGRVWIPDNLERIRKKALADLAQGQRLPEKQKKPSKSYTCIIPLSKEFQRGGAYRCSFPKGKF